MLFSGLNFFIFTISLVNYESEIIQNDQEIITLIENNWNSISTMSGRFEQIDADNNIEYGNLQKVHVLLDTFVFTRCCWCRLKARNALQTWNDKV